MGANDPPATEGQYPAWHKHVDYILSGNPRVVRGQALMRRGGMSVWAVMRSYFVCDRDTGRVLKSWDGWLALEELEAALDFFRDNPEPINRKLWEVAHDGEMPSGWTNGRTRPPSGDALAPEYQARTWQKYIDEYSRRSVPVIRGKGMSVWSVVGYYQLLERDKAQTLAIYRGRLTPEELEAVLDYYADKPEGINRKLWEIAN